MPLDLTYAKLRPINLLHVFLYLICQVLKKLRKKKGG